VKNGNELEERDAEQRSNGADPYGKTLSVGRTGAFVRHIGITCRPVADTGKAVSLRAIAKSAGLLDVYSFAIAAFEMWVTPAMRFGVNGV
jgi:hypothetical protein